MSSQLTAFLDTNMLLHYPAIDKIEWLNQFSVNQIELVLCLTVIDELDKYKNDLRLGERASDVIARTRRGVDTEVRSNVRLLVYIDEDSEFEGIGDRRILKSILKYKQKYPGKAVKMLTEDRGMELRCEAAGIDTISLPSHLRLAQPQDAERKEINSLRRENELLRNQRPKLAVSLYAPNLPDQVPPNVELVRPGKEIPFEEKLENALSAIKEYQREPLKTAREYKQIINSFKQHDHAASQITDESARTIQLKMKLSNEGNAPAKRIQLTLNFPKNIQAIVYRYNLVGERCRPFLPTDFPNRPFASLNRNVTSVPSIPREPAGLYHYGESLTTTQYRFERPELLHRVSVESEIFYITLASWEDVKPFNINCSVHVVEPPDFFEKTFSVIMNQVA
ncbi:MAG TPA: PIN domain-containing protein [Tepidisphaeraceae bacterium]|jgi:hypothetical protein|nr:PIN domain-containing protein [Tepidisphaeraceae bacterium]